MNLSASISDLLGRMTKLTEDKGHLDHPEDAIFLGGSAYANTALQAIVNTAKNTKTVTIKFDGYPALIFGRDAQGRFSIMDKHMFNKKDRTGREVFSPEQFRAYDLARGTDRSELHSLINLIWPGLEKASAGATGYFWGDLLFSHQLQPTDNLFKFKANPNGITYTVETNSEVGKLIAGKTAGIAVHQYMSPDAMTTDQAKSLNGNIGPLQNNSNVAIIPCVMPNSPKIGLDQGLVSAVKKAISQYGADVDLMLDNAPQNKTAFVGRFTTYINRRIVAGDLKGLYTGFIEEFKSNPTPGGMEFQLADYFAQNSKALKGAFIIWIAVYNLKSAVVKQLDAAAKKSPYKGYLDDGTETHEGFVSNGFKFVNRMGFSRQNLAGRK